MSSSPDTAPESDERLTEFPAFELSYTYDEDTEPETVTVYPAECEDEEWCNRWITVDAAIAIDIEAIQ